MSHYAILTDLERCVGCLACVTGCKTHNDVEIGNYWNRVVKIGPTPKYEGAVSPDVEMYFLPIGCQHCSNPECVNVCPTGASQKLDDGTIQIDGELCIGCQLCVSACPYGVRYLNDGKGIVEKCTLCHDRVEEGQLPQCVVSCGGRARWFGDLDEGIDSFEALAPADPKQFIGDSYEGMMDKRVTFGEYTAQYTQGAHDESQLYHLPDAGNEPGFVYLLRKWQWQGLEKFTIQGEPAGTNPFGDAQ